MKKPRDFKQQSRKNRAAASAASPWRQRITVAACVAGFMVFLALFITVSGMITQRAALHRVLAGWTVSYHLTPEQAARIRQIELKFHGNGNPFTSRESGTPEENDAHHLEISRVMNPEDGARFVEVMVKTGGGH